MFKILTDLMNANKEFQIMITVPGENTVAEENTSRFVIEPTMIAKKQTKPEHDLEQDVTDMIHEIGVPAHIKGYQYLREAIFIAIQEDMELAHITPGIYQKVADNFQTTTERVKRAMQHGIEVMLEKASADQVDTFFGPTINLATFKPTISEFLAAAVEGIRLELQHEVNNQ